jgi:hypothetical protein
MKYYIKLKIILSKRFLGKSNYIANESKSKKTRDKLTNKANKMYFLFGYEII